MIRTFHHKASKKEGKSFAEFHKREFNKAIASLPKGIYEIIVKPWRRKATPLQFGYLYGLVYSKALPALIDAGYEFTEIDQVDMFFKSLFANKKIINRETGEIMQLPQSKSEFDTIDENLYCNQIRDYCAEYLNTFIPDPNPNWKQKINHDN
jgi:hypothetical protein